MAERPCVRLQIAPVVSEFIGVRIPSPPLINLKDLKVMKPTKHNLLDLQMLDLLTHHFHTLAVNRIYWSDCASEVILRHGVDY